MFHVPNNYRLHRGLMGSNDSLGNNGAFSVEAKRGRLLVIIASDGMGWEHVSVHATNGTGIDYTPYWDEMQFVKELFWDDEDVVIQYHPARSQYKNVHPNCLHLWRQSGGWENRLPMPALALV